MDKPSQQTAKPDDRHSDSGATAKHEPEQPRCKLCGKFVDVYEGQNPHKQNTAVCPEHGRISLE